MVADLDQALALRVVPPPLGDAVVHGTRLSGLLLACCGVRDGAELVAVTWQLRA